MAVTRITKKIWGLSEGMTFKSLTATENGVYNPQIDGVDGYNKVVVDVAGSGNLQTKEITDNGTFGPDEGYDGFSEVTVDVGLRCLRADSVGTGAYFAYNWQSDAAIETV